MPSRRHPNGILTWRNTFLATVMSILLVGVVILFYFLSVIRSQKGLSQPEQGGLFRPNRTISFPFGHNHKWVNASSDGRCPAHFFRCKGSPRCVELDRRCDGRVDCPNAEDEMECVCAFRMPAAKFCDKYPDCFDESDESFCSYCPLGSFNCGNGQCVAKSKVCDTEIDCDNFMDENFCFRLSNSPLAPVEDFEHAPPTAYKSGYLLRNQRGAWFPVCANPHDPLQSSLASFACVSITANPMVSSTHRFRRFGRPQASRDYLFLYHYQGRFVKWRGCLTNSGIFVSCSDVRCGFNPQQLVPKKPRGRIVGGELSEPGAWPWHAAIYKNGSYSCGATLINNRWLISAAHCFLNHKHNYYEVQLGMLRRRSFTPHQKTYPLDRVIPHHKFNIVTLEYDIALLRTSHPVAFDFWVRPICLPPRVPRETSGALCTAIGWGDTGETEDDSDDLLEVNVPVTKACKRNSDRWMCAGRVEGGRDACQGDSGGPLMCLQEDGFSWYIAGVISGGTGCARPKTPGMYTRVVYYLDWIAKMVASRGRGEITPLKACPGWKCPVLGGGNCLRKERVCDAHVDCYDAQDEANCTTWS